MKYRVDGIKMKEKLITSRALVGGNKFPEMNLIDTLGDKKLMSSLFSDYTLIDFWYSNCTPCIAQFDKLKQIHKSHFSKGFEIVAISTDLKKDEAAWKKIIEKYTLPWVQLGDVDSQIAKTFSINAFPKNFLIDRSGKIIQIDIDLAQLEFYLDAHLK